MIAEFTTKFVEAEAAVKAHLAVRHPDSYEYIVRLVIKTINPDDEYGLPDPKRIHTINDGDYQGTLVFVIGATGYQPDDYWFVKVDYGSCSVCDTLEAIRSYDDEPPSEQQVKDYWTLALHIAQGLKPLGGADAS